MSRKTTSDEKKFISLRLLSQTQSPSDIVKPFISFNPKIWNKGEANTYGRQHSYNGLEITLEYHADLEVDEEISRLLDAVQPFQSYLTGLDDEWEIEISCVLYYSDSAPSLNLDKALIAKLAGISASIDIDLYPI